MPKIKPFRAIRPPQDLAEQVASVPYDVVNRAEARQLAESNNNSFLHVIRPDIDLPDETDPYDDSIYATAAKNLGKLLDCGALVRDTNERLFLYRQVMDGKSQVGVVCCSHVDDYENNRILKHEKTRPAKEDDRTRHVLELNAHAGPVFLTYRNNPSIDEMVDAIVSKPSEVDFTAPDGVQHSVWSIAETATLVAFLSEVPFFYVADGHHRAASAWRAAKSHREKNANHTGEEEYNWFLTVLFPANQLNILAYNRVVADLHGHGALDFLDRLKESHEVQATNDPFPSVRRIVVLVS